MSILYSHRLDGGPSRQDQDDELENHDEEAEVCVKISMLSIRNDELTKPP